MSPLGPALLHQLEPSKLHIAQESIVPTGCIEDESGVITKLIVTPPLFAAIDEIY